MNRERVTDPVPCIACRPTGEVIKVRIGRINRKEDTGDRIANFIVRWCALLVVGLPTLYLAPLAMVVVFANTSPGMDHLWIKSVMFLVFVPISTVIYFSYFRRKKMKKADCPRHGVWYTTQDWVFCTGYYIEVGGVRYIANPSSAIPFYVTKHSTFVTIPNRFSEEIKRSVHDVIDNARGYPTSPRR